MSDHMTPADAESWQEGVMAGGEDFAPEDMTAYVANIATHTLAADTLEYRVEHQHLDNGVWHPVTRWSPEWPLNDGHSVADDERVVCRRVSAPWEVAG